MGTSLALFFSLTFCRHGQAQQIATVCMSFHLRSLVTVSLQAGVGGLIASKQTHIEKSDS